MSAEARLFLIWMIIFTNNNNNKQFKFPFHSQCPGKSPEIGVLELTDLYDNSAHTTILGIQIFKKISMSLPCAVLQLKTPSVLKLKNKSYPFSLSPYFTDHE